MSIFKYLGVSAAEAFLKYQTIRFNTPDAYNDPYEMKVRFKSKVEIEPSSREVKIHLNGNSNSIEQYLIVDDSDYPFRLDTSVFEDICAKVGMSCFSESESQIPDNVLMWAHYAESHRGLAIKLKEKSSTISILSKVNYVSSTPVLDSSILSEPSFFVSDLYFKSKEWKYEQERRLAIPLEACTSLDNKDAYGFPIHVHDLPTEDIEMIFLGSNASSELLKLGYDFYQKFEIPVIKQRVRSDGFGFMATASFGHSLQDCIELNRHYGIK
ncbi:MULTISPECIES: DUF2971 domain-containing protein [Vibrio]|uniref:DUF2971 domain-containing protein n=1 Tax=Vibrio TaxID=662 RepID=UPI001CDCA769|nr:MULTISPECIES: DUF2971 domain-containing protein [Vibrio]MCA2487088.1 DUF2971 domain-containing protein [Vibrio alginolyticus]MCR9385010.1 DUF2971 domain-containing protein [Vibrio alginolyticus]MCR9430515.1 DUF2971 domain-containing protein [Vibrio alginolyticus]MCR9437865.1 DUF2971 domain-containing protein [Vibrio alginolyticus]MCZ4387987.1 DUF2971 domain-containing protein [Vibrio alginolyticus]